GQFNTGVGYQAAITEGKDYSVAFGVSSSVDASYGTAIGARTQVNANFGAAFGTDAKVLAGGSNSVAIGKDAQTSESDVIKLGTGATTVKVDNPVVVVSDMRDKADIRETVLGLGFIRALRPVDYRMDFRENYRAAAPVMPSADASLEDRAAYAKAFAAWEREGKLANLRSDGTRKGERFHHGLLAQEVEAAIRALGVDFGGYKDGLVNGGEDRKALAYEELIAPMIKAIQELSDEVVELRSLLESGNRG
ncbi:MAG: hypothetical protein ACKOWF_12345, partial [Chloroflexota bacterium]